MKKLSAFLVVCSILTPTSAYADSDTVKSILGGIVGSIIVEGVKGANQDNAQDQNQSPQQNQEQIIWDDERGNQKINNLQFSEDINRNKKIQAALKDLGFYEGEIDGLAGSGTQKSIMSWEEENSDNIDGYISPVELKQLEKQAEGVTDNSEDISQDVAEHSPDTLGDFNKDKLQKIKFLQSDIQDFLKTYKGDLDIKRITPDLKILERAKIKPWKDEYDTAYDNLHAYFSGIAGFNEFVKNKKLEKLALDENLRLEYKAEIELVKKFSDDYLRENVRYQPALNLAEQLADIDVEVQMQTYDQAHVLYNKVFATLGKMNLHDQFKIWKSENGYAEPIKSHEESENMKKDDDNKENDRKKTQIPKEEVPFGFWWFFQNMFSYEIKSPLCDSDESKKNIRKLYIENAKHSVPYDFKNLWQVFYDEDLDVRQCRGVVYTNAGEHTIQFTYSRDTDNALGGYIIEAAMYQ